MPDHVIGDGAFGYRHTMLDDTDYVSTWLLRFYGRVDSLGFTARGHV